MLDEVAVLVTPFAVLSSPQRSEKAMGFVYRGSGNSHGGFLVGLDCITEKGKEPLWINHDRSYTFVRRRKPMQRWFPPTTDSWPTGLMTHASSKSVSELVP